MRFLKLLDVETSLKVYYFPESLKTRAVQVLKFQVVLNVTLKCNLNVICSV